VPAEPLDVRVDRGKEAGRQSACASLDCVFVSALGDNGCYEGGVGVGVPQCVPDRIGVEQAVQVVHSLADATWFGRIVVVGKWADVDAGAKPHPQSSVSGSEFGVLFGQDVLQTVKQWMYQMGEFVVVDAGCVSVASLDGKVQAGKVEAGACECLAEDLWEPAG
jgi:hypothetical protein